MLAGLGLQGEVNGSTVTVGSHRLFHDSPAHSPAACRIATRAEENGETAMLIHNGDQVCGVIAAADEIRPESAAVIGELHRLGCRTALLTGDHAAAAQRVADVLGMDDVRAGLLPAEKLAAIRRLAEQPGGAMVGDGINDAPALAAATVGIAMGGAASAQAMDTADVVLMADGLGQLPGGAALPPGAGDHHAEHRLHAGGQAGVCGAGNGGHHHAVAGGAGGYRRDAGVIANGRRPCWGVEELTGAPDGV